jgi:DNA-directed RNA polymerase subunit RPC12/RpoP
MITKVIIDGKENDVYSIFECSNIKSRVKTMIVNDKFILTQRTLIIYECDNCSKKFKVNFRLREKYFKQTILCEVCTRKQTNLDKYGVTSSFATEKTKEKIKQTNLRKYGVEHPLQSKKIMDKFKQTCIDRFGEDHPIKNSQIKEKRKHTNLERYGFECNFASKETKEKIKQTNFDKYGVEAFTQSKEMQEKSKKTNLVKYGFDHAMKNPEIAIKTGEKLKILLINKFVDKLFSNRLINVRPLFNREDYTGSLREYDWECTKCGNIFHDNIAMGKQPRCPICYPILAGTSVMGKEVAEWIKSLGVDIDINTFKIIPPKQLDIYISSHNLAIEFDGLYWHSELNGINKKHHLDKTNVCEKKGIQLLHIFEDEWIEKQDIVKSIIKIKLGLHEKTLGARECEIKEIKSKEVLDFYFRNHLQGQINSSMNLGLFYQNELISCLSFSAPRYNKKYNWEITRFANKLNTKIIGGFAKLFKYFLSNYDGSIITYSDRRYFDGAIYKSNGFMMLKDSPPAYWYIRNQQRFSRVEFQKHKLKDKLPIFDPSLTEWENMQMNGWDRIWDCGNKVFEYQR